MGSNDSLLLYGIFPIYCILFLMLLCSNCPGIKIGIQWKEMFQNAKNTRVWGWKVAGEGWGRGRESGCKPIVFSFLASLFSSTSSPRPFLQENSPQPVHMKLPLRANVLVGLSYNAFK